MTAAWFVALGFMAFIGLTALIMLAWIAFTVGFEVLLAVAMGRNPLKPPEYLKLATYYVTITEQNGDGLHVHHWPSPVEPTRESIINYLMTETSYEFERDFSIDDLSVDMLSVEFKPFTTSQDFVYNRYALAPNRVLTVTRVLTLTGLVA